MQASLTSRMQAIWTAAFGRPSRCRGALVAGVEGAREEVEERVRHQRPKVLPEEHGRVADLPRAAAGSAPAAAGQLVCPSWGSAGAAPPTGCTQHSLHRDQVCCIARRLPPRAGCTASAVVPGTSVGTTAMLRVSFVNAHAAHWQQHTATVCTKHHITVAAAHRNSKIIKTATGRRTCGPRSLKVSSAPSARS